jgi:uncharacterized protein
MRVLELWRYPVKSLQGERLDLAGVTTAGLGGDRRFALFDVDTGFGLTGRRVSELPFGEARLRDDGGVDITLPDGSVTRDDNALSAWLGRRVMLRSADAEVTRRYENPSISRTKRRARARGARSTIRECTGFARVGCDDRSMGSASVPCKRLPRR